MTSHHFSKSGPVTTAESPKLYYAYSNARIVFDDFSVQDSIKSTMCFKKYPKHTKNKPKSCIVTWGKIFYWYSLYFILQLTIKKILLGTAKESFTSVKRHPTKWVMIFGNCASYWGLMSRVQMKKCKNQMQKDTFQVIQVDKQATEMNKKYKRPSSIWKSIQYPQISGYLPLRKQITTNSVKDV